MHGFRRRTFLAGLVSAPAVTAVAAAGGQDDLMAYVRRTSGGWDQSLYARLLGHANAFKEGDEIVGVAAPDATARALDELFARAT